jgi:hypothetical protein
LGEGDDDDSDILDKGKQSEKSEEKRETNGGKRGEVRRKVEKRREGI